MSTKDKILALREEADRLEQEANLRQAYESLRRASQHEYEAREVLGFPDWMRMVTPAIEIEQRNIALRLGHQERLEKLVACGMDEDRVEIHDLLDDDTAASVLATWLFDLFGGYEAALVNHKEYVDVSSRVFKFFPLGLNYYMSGKHDT